MKDRSIAENLNQFHRLTIDSAVNDLLETFFELANKDAIAALAILIDLPKMPEDAKEYPSLPELFEQEVYQKIQSELKLLCQMMYNRQPQDNAKYSGDQGPDTNFGLFGLRMDKNESIKAEEVHEYLRYKFSLTACSMGAFAAVQQIIKEKNTNSFYKSLYYKSFAQWVKQPSGEAIPAGMKTIIRDITAELSQTVLTEESLAPFRPYINETEEITSYLCSLSPDTFDTKMKACLEVLFYEKWLDRTYQSVQKKLQNQITDGEGAFSLLEEVCLDFVTVVKAYKALKVYGEIISTHDEALVTKAELICQDYITQLQNNDASTQTPLEEANAVILNQFIYQVEEFTNETQFKNWIGNFFANYFSADLEETIALLMKVYKLALNKDKLFIVNEQWLERIVQENTSIENDKVEIEIELYHVNRILLHALTTSVETWSLAFHDMFNEILNLLKEMDSRFYLTQALKRDSYPEELMAQLDWLNKLYESHANNNRNAQDQPERVFPLLCYPEKITNFCNLLKDLSAKQIKTLCESINLAWLNNFIGDIAGLKSLKEELPEAKWKVFSESLDNQVLKEIPKMVADLKQIKSIVSDEKWNKFVETLDDDYPKHLVKYIYNLQDLKNLFSDKKWISFSESLDNEYLRGLISSLDDLMNIKKLLTEKKWISFVESLDDDYLKGFINNSSDWKSYFRGFSKKTLNLQSIKEILTDTKWNSFSESLDDDYLKGFINNSSDLTFIKEILPDKKWNSFKESLDINFIIDLILKDPNHTIDPLKNILVKEKWDDLEARWNNLFLHNKDNKVLLTRVERYYSLETMRQELPEAVSKFVGTFSFVVNGSDKIKPLMQCVRECLSMYRANSEIQQNILMCILKEYRYLVIQDQQKENAKGKPKLDRHGLLLFAPQKNKTTNKKFNSEREAINALLNAYDTDQPLNTISTSQYPALTQSGSLLNRIYKALKNIEENKIETEISFVKEGNFKV